MATGEEFTVRRQKQGVEHPKQLGDLLNQPGSYGKRTSANSIPDIMGQGSDDKRGNPGTSKLRRYMGQ